MTAAARPVPQDAVATQQAQALKAPKTVQLQVDGLVRVYESSCLFPNVSFVFGNLEKAQTAYRQLLAVKETDREKASSLNYRSPFSGRVAVTDPKTLEECSVDDASEYSFLPDNETTAFSLLMLKTKDFVGKPMKTADDLIACAGKAMATRGLGMKDVPVVQVHIISNLINDNPVTKMPKAEEKKLPIADTLASA